jgi:glycerol uptake facilitator-like aquaporin
VNPAVTVCLLVVGRIDVISAVMYIIAQFTGSIVGSLFLRIVIPSQFRSASAVRRRAPRRDPSVRRR